MTEIDKEKNLVSIIIPVYNVQDDLDRAIASASEQEYKNTKIVLVDDGSNDNSGEICDKWAVADRRIIVIHKPNRGVSSARNVGIDVATGDYVCFMDGDDYIAKELVGDATQYMAKENDMVAFRYCAVCSNERRYDIHIENGEYILSKPESLAEFYIATLMRYRIGWEVTNRVFRRDIIDKMGLRFAEDANLAEDMLFTICYCFGARKIKSINKTYYYYCIRENSFMQKEKTHFYGNRMNELSKKAYSFFVSHDDTKSMLKYFPVIHFYIMFHHVSRYRGENNLHDLQIRRILLEDIDDKDYFLSMLQTLLRERKTWSKYTDHKEISTITKIARYWLNGNVVEYGIRSCYIKTCVLLSRIKKCKKK